MRLHSCITWSSALDKAHCSSVSCQAIMDMPNVVCRPAHKFTPSLTHILLVRTVTCKALVRIGSTMQPRAWAVHGQVCSAVCEAQRRVKVAARCAAAVLPQVGVILAVLVAGERAKRR